MKGKSMIRIALILFCVVFIALILDIGSGARFIGNFELLAIALATGFVLLKAASSRH